MSAADVRRAYDRLAPSYDEDFTASLIAGLQRAAFWRLVGDQFQEGRHVLDLGCGTGEDAVRLARQGCTVDGIDVSPAMIEAARERIALEGVGDQVELRALPIERLEDLPPERYDGVISNFGPINCVRDLEPLARTLGVRVRPGGVAALSVMSRTCLWETLLYPLTVWAHRASRTSSADYEESRVAGEESYTVTYPSLRSIAQTFEPEFLMESAPGIGVFLPPTYLEPFAQRFPRLIGWLARLDQAVAGAPLFRSLADHRLVILRRRED